MRSPIAGRERLRIDVDLGRPFQQLGGPNWRFCNGRCNAVMLAAVRDGAGRRRVVSLRDTGAFPVAVVARAKCELRAFGPSLEFHLHLLASSPAEREATVADLAIVVS